MTNRSDGVPQVPFGDGNHVPPEEMSPEENLLDFTTQTVMEKIFLSCDQNEAGVVPVSHLINFLTPFMLSHMSKLMELKKALDPFDIDPLIDRGTFFTTMSEWCRLLEQPTTTTDGDETTEELSTVDPEDSEESRILPITNFRCYFLKHCSESEVANVSCSSFTNTQSNIKDLETMQEDIKELEHHNRKLTIELEHVKSLLSNSEERNEVLLADVNRITRRLLSEQHANKQLDRDIRNTEELLEASNTAQKQIVTLEKELAYSEKQLVQFRQNVHNLETETKKLESTVDKLSQREQSTKKMLVESQAAIHTKEQEITALEETNAHLNSLLSEQQQIVEHYAQMNECWKEDKAKLEKLMEYQTQSNFLKPTSDSQQYHGPAQTCNCIRSKTNNQSLTTNFPYTLPDINSEDDLSWKLQFFNVFPNESVQSEILQAREFENSTDGSDHEETTKQIQSLKAANNEYKKIIEQLKRDNMWLKMDHNTANEQSSSEIELMKMKLESESVIRTKQELERISLQVQIQDLENDNAQKYIKIIDLMEQKEVLEKEIHKINSNLGECTRVVKLDLSKFDGEKQRFLKQLEKITFDKQNLDMAVKHLQSVKSECENLQNELGLPTENKNESANKGAVKGTCENLELKLKIDQFNRSISNLNEEKGELNEKLESLVENFAKFRNDTKVRTAEEMKLIELTSEVDRLKKENQKLKLKCVNLRAVENNYNEAQKELEAHTDRKNSVIVEHAAEVDALRKKIVDMSATSSQNITENNQKIALLKQKITYQNEGLKAIEGDKKNLTKELYEQQSENDRLMNDNKQLSEKLKGNETDRELMQIQCSKLEKSIVAIKTEYELISSDYTKTKDSYNIVLRDHQLLLSEKELLIEKITQFEKDSETMRKLNEATGKKLLIITLNYEEASVKNDVLKKAMAESNAKQQSAQAEIARLLEELHQMKSSDENIVQFSENLHLIEEKLTGVENTNQVLQKENVKLHRDFEEIRENYQRLTYEKDVWEKEKHELLERQEELAKKIIDTIVEQEARSEENATAASQTILDGPSPRNAAITTVSSEKYRSSNHSATSMCNPEASGPKRIQRSILESMEEFCRTIPESKFDTEEVNLRISDSLSNTFSEDDKNQLKSIIKIQLKNEKLKNLQKKINLLEEQLKSEIQNSEGLEFDISRLQEELQQTINRSKEETLNITNELKKVSGDLQRSNGEKEEIELEKNSLAKDNMGLKQKLAASRCKESRFKSISSENDQLRQELEIFLKQKSYLEKKVERYQNLLKIKICSEKAAKEQEIGSSTKKGDAKVEVDLKNKGEENKYLKEEISELQNEKSELEKKLHKSQRDLQKSEVKNFSIRKELTNILSGYDNVMKNFEDSTNFKNIVRENETLQNHLESCNIEITDLKIKLSDSSNYLSLLSNYVNAIKEKLGKRRKPLHRSTLTVVDTWRTALEGTSSLNMALEAYERGDPVISPRKIRGPLDEEFFYFKEQIHFTVLVLDTLSSLKLKGELHGNQRKDAEVQVPCTPSPSFAQKVYNIISSRYRNGEDSLINNS